MTTRVGQGLLIVYTGNGKGKTTAALGLLWRALGAGLRVCVIQFVKSERGRWGETLLAERLGVEWHAMGRGFVCDPAHQAEDAGLAREGWALAREKISSRDYDVVLLDEFTYPLAFGWLDREQVVGWLMTERPRSVHVVITGRSAPAELIAAADLVTEMVAIKHPYDAGIRAQAGIEF